MDGHANGHANGNASDNHTNGHHSGNENGTTSQNPDERYQGMDIETADMGPESTGAYGQPRRLGDGLGDVPLHISNEGRQRDTVGGNSIQGVPTATLAGSAAAAQQNGTDSGATATQERGGRAARTNPARQEDLRCMYHDTQATSQNMPLPTFQATPWTVEKPSNGLLCSMEVAAWRCSTCSFLNDVEWSTCQNRGADVPVGYGQGNGNGNGNWIGNGSGSGSRVPIALNDSCCGTNQAPLDRVFNRWWVSLGFRRHQDRRDRVLCLVNFVENIDWESHLHKWRRAQQGWYQVPAVPPYADIFGREHDDHGSVAESRRRQQQQQQQRLSTDHQQGPSSFASSGGFSRPRHHSYPQIQVPQHLQDQQPQSFLQQLPPPPLPPLPQSQTQHQNQHQHQYQQQQQQQPLPPAPPYHFPPSGGGGGYY